MLFGCVVYAIAHQGQGITASNWVRLLRQINVPIQG